MLVLSDLLLREKMGNVFPNMVELPTTDLGHTSSVHF